MLMIVDSWSTKKLQIQHRKVLITYNLIIVYPSIITAQTLSIGGVEAQVLTVTTKCPLSCTYLFRIFSSFALIITSTRGRLQPVLNF